MKRINPQKEDDIMEEDELDFEREHHGFYCDEDEEGYEEEVAELDSYYREKWNNIKKNIWDSLDDD